MYSSCYQQISQSEVKEAQTMIYDSSDKVKSWSKSLAPLTERFVVNESLGGACLWWQKSNTTTVAMIPNK